MRIEISYSLISSQHVRFSMWICAIALAYRLLPVSSPYELNFITWRCSWHGPKHQLCPQSEIERSTPKELCVRHGNFAAAAGATSSSYLRESAFLSYRSVLPFQRFQRRLVFVIVNINMRAKNSYIDECTTDNECFIVTQRCRGVASILGLRVGGRGELGGGGGWHKAYGWMDE